MDETKLKKIFADMDRKQLEEIAVHLFYLHDNCHKLLCAKYDLI